jgi:hypothetical protein
LLANRVDKEAEDMSIAADPEAVLEAFKEAQGGAAADSPGGGEALLMAADRGA